MGTIRGQYSDNPWKSKLRVSQAEKKYLSKCLARKKVSLALLQLAFKKEKAAHQLLRSQMLKTEQMLGEVPFGHQFPCVLMYLVVFFQVNLGLSYRQCSAVLAHFLNFLHCTISSPSYSTIRVWRIAAQTHKLACYVPQSPILDDEPGLKWCLVVDESAAIGKEKMLTVLASPILPEQDMGSLCAAKMQVLVVETAYSWTSEHIAQVLAKGVARLKGTVVGIISDRCSNLLIRYQIEWFQTH